jgi:hypothetical protein
MFSRDHEFKLFRRLPNPTTKPQPPNKSFFITTSPNFRSQRPKRKSELPCLKHCLFDHLNLFRISDFEFRVFLASEFLGDPFDLAQDMLCAFARDTPVLEDSLLQQKRCHFFLPAPVRFGRILIRMAEFLVL